MAGSREAVVPGQEAEEVEKREGPVEGGEVEEGPIPGVAAEVEMTTLEGFGSVARLESIWAMETSACRRASPPAQGTLLRVRQALLIRLSWRVR